MSNHPGGVVAHKNYFTRPHTLAGEVWTKQARKIGRPALPPGFLYQPDGKIAMAAFHQQLRQRSRIEQPATPFRCGLGEDLITALPVKAGISNFRYDHRLPVLYWPGGRPSKSRTAKETKSGNVAGLRKTSNIATDLTRLVVLQGTDNYGNDASVLLPACRGIIGRDWL